MKKLRKCSCGRITKYHGTVCGGCSKRQWRASNVLRDVFSNFKSNARRRRIPFEITLEDFEIWCGLTGYLELRGLDDNSMTIDRIDPTKGYSYGNMKMITKSENSAKGNKERGLRPRVQVPKEINDPF